MIVKSIEDTGARWSDSIDSAARCWTSECVQLGKEGTHFGFVYQGQAELTCEVGAFYIPTGCYFAIPGPMSVAGDAKGLLVTKYAHKGFFSIGGPIEHSGRLRYINGCSDSVLISPPRVGDPCLNFLHVPPGVNQTPHTHPSVRIGIVVSGQGHCCFGANEVRPLMAGHMFVLPVDELHSFHTVADELRIVVYHPDSDVGPSDDAHPMVTKTFVDGKSASKLPEIRTVFLGSQQLNFDS